MFFVLLFRLINENTPVYDVIKIINNSFIDWTSTWIFIEFQNNLYTLVYIKISVIFNFVTDLIVLQKYKIKLLIFVNNKLLFFTLIND